MGAEDKRAHRVKTKATRATLGGEPKSVRVLNLSLGGACLVIPRKLDVPTGRAFSIRFDHPHLQDRVQLPAEIVWRRTGRCGKKKVAFAGVRFTELEIEPAVRLSLRRCMVAEYGSSVLFEGRLVGYAVGLPSGAWTLHDTEVSKIATLAEVGNRLELTRPGVEPEHFASFSEAAASAFGIDGSPRIDPPIQVVASSVSGSCEEVSSVSASEDIEATGPLSGSCVRYCGATVGYIAMTSPGVWSFYDSNKHPAGFMTHVRGERWKIVLLGANDDGSLDLQRADSYPEALAVAFRLEDAPELRSTIFYAKSA